jgi:hypothetical protein
MLRWEPLDQRAESFLALDTGQRRPETMMDPGPECHMGIRVPRDVELVGFRKLRGVAIGGRNEPPGSIEFAEDIAAQFDIFRRDAL